MKLCNALLSACLASQAVGDVAKGWTNPNANLPGFSSTYLVGEKILLSWQALNNSKSDLWLTRWDTETDTFSLRLQTDLDISVASSYAWQIAVDTDEVLKDTRFELEFITSGGAYDANSTDDYITSPAFNLQIVNQAAPPNGTVGEVLPSSTTSVVLSTTAAATTSTTAFDPPPVSYGSARNTLPIGAIVGISIAVVVFVAATSAVAGYIWFRKRAQKKNETRLSNGDVNMQGPYEVLADRKHPTEMGTKEAQIHEMMVSKETIVSEAASSPVHEVSNTVKRPGLHEMPG